MPEGGELDIQNHINKLEFGFKNHNDQGIERVTSLEELPGTTERYLPVSIEFKAIFTFLCVWVKCFLAFDTCNVFYIKKHKSLMMYKI